MKKTQCLSKGRHRRTRTRKRCDLGVVGGGIETAKNYFYRNIKKNYKDHVYPDFYVRIANPGVKFPNIKDVETYDDKDIETHFTPLVEVLIKQTNNKDLIDFVVQLYLTGNLTLLTDEDRRNGYAPMNSIQHIEQLNDYATKFNVLKQYRMNDGKQLSMKDFPSLFDLERFIHDKIKQGFFEKIEEKKSKRSKTSLAQKRLREDGEDDAVVVLRTQNYTVYQPTSEIGSNFYGRNTKWCTAADKNNMFCHYNEKGKFYIIQNQDNPTDKYQYHPNDMQFKNSHDHPVSAEEVRRLFQDKQLKEWFKQVTAEAIHQDKYTAAYTKAYGVLYYMAYRTSHKQDLNLNLFNAIFSPEEMRKEMELIIKTVYAVDGAVDGGVNGGVNGGEDNDDDDYKFQLLDLLSDNELAYLVQNKHFVKGIFKLKQKYPTNFVFSKPEFKKYSVYFTSVSLSKSRSKSRSKSKSRSNSMSKSKSRSKSKSKYM